MSMPHPHRCDRLWVEMLFVVALLAVLVVAPQAIAQGASQLIAVSGEAAPDGNGTFDFLTTPLLNNAGQVAFQVKLMGTSGGANDDRVIYRGDGATLTQIAREFRMGVNTLSITAAPWGINDAGRVVYEVTRETLTTQPTDQVRLSFNGGASVVVAEFDAAPDGMGGTNGMFSGFVTPVLNNSGQVASIAGLTGTLGGTSDDEGIFLGSGGAVTQVTREGQAVPDGNGVFSSFSTPALNDSGQVAFRADLTGTSGGTSDNEGIFLRSGGSVTRIVREGQAAPDGNGVFSSLTSPSLNGSGQAVFRAFLTGTSGGASDDEGIFQGSGSAVTQVARAGQAAPDGNGVFSDFGSPALNDLGQVVFEAGLTGTAGGSSDNRVLLLSNGMQEGSFIQVAREGQAAPDGNGVFSTFLVTALNGSGQAVFTAFLAGTVGGASDDIGLFIGDGIDVVQVAREGRAMGDSSITDTEFSPNTGSSGDTRSGINNAGQVAYKTTLANGGQAIGLWTPPDVHWAGGSGPWIMATNWAQGITPKSMFDVFLNPAVGATIDDGFGHEFVKSLTVGHAVGAQVILNQNSSNLTALKGPITINATGRINLDNGHVLTASALTNEGVIAGDGQVDAVLDNTATGEVRVVNGDQLTFTGANNSNDGQLNLFGRATLEFTQGLANNPGGFVSGNGTLIATGGLTNDGTMNFSATANISGDVTNKGLIISAGGTTTFFDDVDNTLGEIRTSQDSFSVFFGSVNGGTFSGPGTVVIEGDLKPGSSPGISSFGGDVTLGVTAGVTIELAGTNAGVDYDRVIVAGDLAAGGVLDIDLLGGFMPQVGDTFDVLDFGSMTGSFSSVVLPSLAGDLSFDTSSLLTTGVISVVPEPGALTVLAVGWMLVLRRQR